MNFDYRTHHNCDGVMINSTEEIIFSKIFSWWSTDIGSNKYNDNKIDVDDDNYDNRCDDGNDNGNKSDNVDNS